MQENTTAKDFQAIISKYCNARWTQGITQYAILELVYYLVGRKGGYELNNLIYEIQSTLGKYHKYQEGILTPEEENILADNYREVVEQACNAGDYGQMYKFESYQPKEITEYVAGFFRPGTKSGIFYNPFYGFGSYALALPEYKFIGEELNASIWALAIARLHANGRTDCFPHCGDSLDHDSKEMFDGVITTPPFGMRGDLAIEKLIERYYEHLTDNGVLVMVIPTNFLMSTNPRIQDVKFDLIRNRAVSHITLFPEGIIPNTALASAMIVITKAPNKTIVFTNASKAYTEKPGIAKCRVFSKDMLEKQIATQVEEDLVTAEVDYDKVIEMMSLYPPRFLSPIPVFASNNLEDICEISNLASFPDGAKNARYFSPAKLTPDFARTPFNAENLERKDLKAGRYYFVDFPAVLFDYNPKTDVTRVAYTDTYLEEGFVVSQGVNVLDLRDNRVSAKFLMLMLSDNRVKRQLKERMVGAFIPRLRAADLANIQIPSMPLDEQDLLIINAMDESMSDAERELKDSFTKYKKEVRIRKHALSQTISSLSALWNSFEKYREGKETISGNDMIGRANPISIDSLCQKISSLMTTIISQTENIADVENNWGKPEWIDFLLSVPMYARKYEDPSFSTVIKGSSDPQWYERWKQFFNEDRNFNLKEWLDSEEQYDKHLKECIEFPVKAFERIILNIVSNAKAYGFTDKTRKDYKILYDWFEEDGNIVLAISNNGTPLKDDANAEMVLSYGYSTNLNEDGHSGIGGHEIASIMEQFDGKAEFISTPDEEFTVTYKLTFTKCSEFMPEDEED